tara:strand:- start:259 stop:492 length:234 start_codon:yes stop_codon:yes gene_type:complete
MIKAIILEKLVKAVSKKFKLDKVLKYVEDPNDADDRIDKLETTVFQQGRLIEFMLAEKPCKCKKKKFDNKQGEKDES